MEGSRFYIVYSMPPFLCRKRVFGFLLHVRVILEEKDGKLEFKAIPELVSGRSYCGFIATVDAPKELSDVGRETVARLIKAAFSLSYLQLAYPEHRVMDNIAGVVELMRGLELRG